MLQESSSSHNIPHVALPNEQKHHHNYPMQMLSYSVSNSSDLGCVSPTHATGTPQLKKKQLPVDTSHSKRESAVAKHQSFDYAASKGKVLLLCLFFFLFILFIYLSFRITNGLTYSVW